MDVGTKTLENYCVVIDFDIDSLSCVPVLSTLHKFGLLEHLILVVGSLFEHNCSLDHVDMISDFLFNLTPEDTDVNYQQTGLFWCDLDRDIMELPVQNRVDISDIYEVSYLIVDLLFKFFPFQTLRAITDELAGLFGPLALEDITFGDHGNTTITYNVI